MIVPRNIQVSYKKDMKLCALPVVLGFHCCLMYHTDDLLTFLIPGIRYLLPEHMGPCTLRITYSAHTDLSVKFQSHRSRYSF